MSGSSLNRRRCCCCHLRRRRQRTWSTDSKTLLDLAGSSLDTPVPEHIEELRSQLAAKQEKQTDCHARWRSLPRIVVRSLVLHGPIGASFSQSILMSRSMRVLFLVSELLGAFMIETLLFEASGDTLRKTAPKECSSECDEMGGDHCFWEQVGYYIAVGVISALVAGIPVALMSALHHRDLKRVKNQKHKKFQLKLWRIQDSILWMIGVCYCAFAINYLTLFFASVSADNHGDWFVGAATILLMVFAVVPFLVSLSVPLLALSILSVLSCTHQMPKRTVMEERLAAKLSFGGVKSADGTETNEEQPVPHEHAAAASTSSSGAVGAEQPTQGSDNAARERSTMETKQVPVQAPPEQPTAEPVHVDVRQAAPEEPTAEPVQVPVRQAEPASKSGPNCAQAPAVSDGPASVVKPTGLSL